MDFEKALQRLEVITQQLESGELSLDDSLKMFEEGIKLSGFCEKKLTDVEQKMNILSSDEIVGVNNTDNEVQDNISTSKKSKSKKKEVKTEENQTEENVEDKDFLF